MLKGHSLVEVIVSTIIILITFLLFSSLIGQLVTESRTVQGLKMLYHITGVTPNDTTALSGLYTNSHVTVEQKKINNEEINHLTITSKTSDKVLYRYYFYSEIADLYMQ